jgi:DNA-directed RNA polymerase subunit L
MKVNILEKKKDTLIIEIEGVRHTLPNALRNELWNDSSVTLSAYEKKHPYLGNPKLIIKGKNPKKSLQDAIKRTQDKIKVFEREFKKVVK